MRFPVLLPAVLLFAYASLASASDAAVQLAPGSVFEDCASCPRMVVIPPGNLTMGFDGGEKDRYEGPVRQLRIENPFAAGQYPVTNAEYGRFISDSGYATTEGCNFWDFDNRELIKLAGSSWRDPGHGRPIRDNEPVVCVSWHDIKAYTRWLSQDTGMDYRLLAEAEWEYIASDRADTDYPWGDDPNDACSYANVADLALVEEVGADQFMGANVNCNDGYARIAPVDAFPPNSFGVYDLIGNSWEWVEDCYLMSYPDGPLDGSAVQVSGECDRRAVRGGAWITNSFRQRPSWRGRDPEDKLTFIFGFRVARDLP